MRMTRRCILSTSLALAVGVFLRRAATAGAPRSSTICTLAPEQEVGPYYVSDELVRSDIAEDQPGLPLALRIIVLDARTCKALQNAAIDIWHCNALGVYSGFTQQPAFRPSHSYIGPEPGFDAQHREDRPPPPDHLGPPPASRPTDKLTFLRGIQISGSDGAVGFQTIFPGVYMGRTNHIHFKVRVGGSSLGKIYQAGHTSHVGQLFFPESMAAELMKEEPYRQHAIHRTTLNEDNVFEEGHGELTIVQVRYAPLRRAGRGLAADLVVAIDPGAMPSEARGHHSSANPSSADEHEME
jgi:protocatechuate 3,4-dioxygenase beta subunit